MSITFAISGKSMGIIEGSELYQRPQLYDNGQPDSIRAGEALKTAIRRRAGKGWSYRITCDVEAAMVIREYCADVGATFAAQGGYGDEDVRADGRALLATAERIDAALAQQESKVQP